MATCPNCKRNSLEHSQGRKVAWCLYINDCGFVEVVENYNDFLERFEKTSTPLQEETNTCEI